MACEPDCDPDIFDLINNLSELCSNVNEFRNAEDFEISKTTNLYAPLCMAHGIDKRKQQNVSIVNHKNYADYDLKDLLSEIKVVSKLQHSNLLKFYENSISLDDKKIGFIYESHACLLSEALDEDVQIIYRPEVIKRIMKELFSALDYLHKNSVVHRDIQHENIILTHSGAVKVWNFWCAQTVGEPLVEMKSSDFRYQPVESILLEGTVHPSLDIWSANVIFGELWLKTFIFPIVGKDFMLASIFALFGFPTKRIWEDFFNFRDAEKLQVYSAYE
ncbi:Cyclin-dependent kinase F-3 [Araneus ventricosus]|uniref:Cyclin-dependent kinase F-3 n=1 Tax=Araneus ventricosus TaxID=182803 RepID=A0A4Y2QYX7_ARAVE|nr:Cyclin-dependent kinase F-3 [Araneus ventricosus]